MKALNSVPTLKGVFTLIELLVVIAIISILASLLLPALGKSKEMARQASCRSLLKNHGLAINMYANDYTSCMPPLVFYSGNSHMDGRDNPWDAVLLPYFNTDVSADKIEAFHCPDDNTPRVYGPKKPQSYIYNANRAPSDAVYNYSPELKPLASIISPSSLVAIVCGNTVWARGVAGTSACPPVGLTDKRGIGYSASHIDPWGDTTTLYFNHNLASNYLMIDGHVELLKNTDMFGYWQQPYGDKPSKKRWWNH